MEETHRPSCPIPDKWAAFTALLLLCYCRSLLLAHHRGSYPFQSQIDRFLNLPPLTLDSSSKWENLSIMWRQWHFFKYFSYWITLILARKKKWDLVLYPFWLLSLEPALSMSLLKVWGSYLKNLRHAWSKQHVRSGVIPPSFCIL